ncbi:MAG: hypothetical protein U0168_03915 [Nannocystaceae bacterium]
MHNYDLYEECRASAGLSETDACVFELDLGIDAHQGTIAYTRFQARSAAEMSPVCVTFASCAAQARAGQRIPMPTNAEDTVVVQEVRARPIPKAWNDPRHIEEIVAALELDLQGAREQLSADQTDDPELAYRFQSQEQLVAYLRERAGRLEASSSG